MGGSARMFVHWPGPRTIISRPAQAVIRNFVSPPSCSPLTFPSAASMARSPSSPAPQVHIAMPDSPSTTSSTPTPPKPTSTPKGSAFWLSFLAIVVCNILSALDVTAVSTTLPTITHDLGGDNDFVWVGAAYGLASTAMLPFCGRLADVFGRRPIMMISVAFFFVGSALCGSAQNMNMLIAARSELISHN